MTDLPKGWTEAALGDVCKIVSGATPKTGVGSFWGGGIKWATPKDLSDLKGAKFLYDTPRSLTGSGLSSCGANVLPAGSVLFSSRAPIGLTAINRVPVATNQGFKSLIPTDAVNADFLLHWLRAHRPSLEALGRGATFKEVSKAIVGAVQIPLPPIEEQRRIAAILDKADDLRAKRRAALAQLDTLTQAIFLDMFGDPAQNPKGWPLSFVGQHARIAGGFIFKSSDFHDVGVPIIRISDLGDDWVDVSRAARIPVEKLGKGSRYAVVAGDILISMSGSIGKVAVVPDSLPGTAYQNQRVGRYVLKGDHRIISDYLLAFVRSHYHQGKVAELSTGVAQKNISGSQLESISMPLPPVNVQRQYASLMAETQVSLGSQRKSLDGMNQFFDSLQHRAFSGAL